MFFGLLDPDTDQFVTAMDPNPSLDPVPDSSIYHKAKNKKNLESYCFVTSF